MPIPQDKLISVIIGIYNCGETLADALDSILNQTYTNWEIILCDDCSADKSLEIAEEYRLKHPDKIHILKNLKNYGLNITLNRCLDAASGEYIARMDGDDLCPPDRFEKEIAVLEENPEISFVSSDMNFFDKSGIWGKTDVKERPQIADFLQGTQFCHAACMVRRDAYKTVGGYSVDKRLLRVEDYHLWVKMYEKGMRGVNIKEPLYMMRDDRNAMRRRTVRNRLNECYVKHLIIKQFNLQNHNYFFCLKPLLLTVMPGWLYNALHRNKLRKPETRKSI